LVAVRNSQVIGGKTRYYICNKQVMGWEDRIMCQAGVEILILLITYLVQQTSLSSGQCQPYIKKTYFISKVKC